MIPSIDLCAALDGVTAHWSPRVLGRGNAQCAIMLIETVTTKHTGGVDTPRTRSLADQLGSSPVPI